MGTDSLSGAHPGAWVRVSTRGCPDPLHRAGSSPGAPQPSGWERGMAGRELPGMGNTDGGFTAASPQDGSGASTRVPGIDVGVLSSPPRPPPGAHPRGDLGERCPTDGTCPMDVPRGPLQTCRGGTCKATVARTGGGEGRGRGEPCLPLFCLQPPAVLGARGGLPGGCRGLSLPRGLQDEH